MIWWLLGGFGTLGVVAVGAGWWLAGRPEAGVHAAPRGSDNEDGCVVPSSPVRAAVRESADRDTEDLSRPGPDSSRLGADGRYAGSSPGRATGTRPGELDPEPVRWPLGGAPVPGRVRLVLDGAAQLVAVAGLVLADTP